MYNQFLQHIKANCCLSLVIVVYFPRIITSMIFLWMVTFSPWFLLLIVIFLRKNMTAMLYFYEFDPLLLSKYFRKGFFEIQSKNECNLLLVDNKRSSGFSKARVTEFNKTFDEILIRPHKAWYLGNIKCDLGFYIVLTLMSPVMNEIISLNVCTLMMCLSVKHSTQ